MPLVPIVTETRRASRDRIPQFEDNINSGEDAIQKLHEELKAAGLRDSKREIGKKEAQAIIDTAWFQFAVNGMTLLNTVQMGIEADHPDWTGIWTVTENLFTAGFTIEMITKLYVLHLRYFRDKANVLDGFLTTMGILDCWILTVLPGSGADLQSLSILRVLRLVRLARIFKLMRNFKPMVLMLEGIVKTISVTVYVFGLLLLCFYVFAIFFTQYMGAQGNPDLYPGYSMDVEVVDSQAFMLNYNPAVCWGSMASSMLTLFNLALLTEWSEVIRPIAWKQPIFIMVLILFVIFVAFGVMNVMIGLIVDSVITESKRMDEDYDATKKKEKLMLLEAIQHLLRDMDTNHDDEVSLEELEVAMQNDPRFGDLLKMIDLPDAWEPRELLLMLDNNGDGLMAKAEFTTGFFRLIESNDFQHLCLMQAGLNEIKKNVLDVAKELHAKMLKVEEVLHSLTIATNSAKSNQDNGHCFDGNSHDSSRDFRETLDAAFDAAYVVMKESFHAKLAAEKSILKTWLTESCTISGEDPGKTSHVNTPAGCHETCTNEAAGNAIVEAPAMFATDVKCSGHSNPAELCSRSDAREEVGSSKLLADNRILDGINDGSCTKSDAEAQHINAASQAYDFECAAVFHNLDVGMPQLEIGIHQLEANSELPGFTTMSDPRSATSDYSSLYAAAPCNHAGDATPAVCVDLLNSSVDQSANTQIHQRDSIIYFRFEDGTQKLGFEVNWVTDALPLVGNVFPDGAANLCGVLPGDRIAECNGLSLIGKDRMEVLGFLRARPLVLQMFRSEEIVSLSATGSP